MDQISLLIGDYIEALNSEGNRLNLYSIVNKIRDFKAKGRRVFIFGNGGSASTASHFASDLQSCDVRAICLNDNNAILTKIANDFGYEHVFDHQLVSALEPVDMIVAISGSGNSRNITKALEWAKHKGAYAIGLLGANGGKARSLCVMSIIVPSGDYGVIEGVHSCLTHIIVEMLRHG